MKEYEASNIRNLALIGHGSAGKTILAESMLACGGAITRIGSVEQGSTVSDYHEDEQQRQISIHTTSMYAEWKSCKLNILDSPGYADFVGEALSALRVADSAILTVHGAHGIELGTEQMWEKVCDMKMPTLVAVNVLDAEYVKFDQIVEDLSNQFGKRFFPDDFTGQPRSGV
jgi:small GTP-binding protein domain